MRMSGQYSLPKTGLETLSSREMEVFTMLGHGKKTSDIAKVLFRSIKTIETYCARLRMKLDLPGMHEVRIAAVKHVNGIK